MFQSNPKFGRFLFPLVLVSGLLFGPRASADPLDGWWVSDGYGLVLEIKGERIKALQITAISCLPDWTAKRQDKTSEGAEAVFVITPASGKILVKPGSSS